MKASDAIWAMVSGYARPDRERKLLMFLQAYVDDSATDWGERRLYLAGYVDTAPRWAAFSDQWKAVLDSDPRVERFKTSELNAGADMARKLPGLMQVIQGARPFSFDTWVSRVEFDRAFGPPNKRSYWMNPYSICFYFVMYVLYGTFIAHELKPFPTVEFVFDEHGALGHDAAYWFNQVRGFLPDHFRQSFGSSPQFRDDELVLPLQAADLLASMTRRNADPVIADEQARRLLADLRHPKHMSIDVTPQLMQELAAELKQAGPLRSQRKPKKPFSPSVK